MTKRTLLRRLPRVVVPAVAATIVARGVLRRRPALAPVNADIRSAVLYLPVSLTSVRLLRLLQALPAPPTNQPPGLEVTSRTVPGASGPVRVVVHKRADRASPGPALVWLHGGGMVLGTPEQAHVLCSRWAEELDLLVVSPDYRLAPDHPFPAGLDDCYSTLVWVHENAEELGVDPDRIAVGGDSAGGGLAAALSQMARDRGGPAICFQLLEYPMIDDRTVLRADAEHDGRGAFVWTPASNRFGWTCYLGRAPVEGEAPRWAAPARTTDLAGLPSAWVGVGDLDLFHDEDVDYAERLRAAGVACPLHVETGMYHGADSVRPKAATSVRFRDAMTAALAGGVAASTARASSP